MKIDKGSTIGVFRPLVQRIIYALKGSLSNMESYGVRHSCRKYSYIIIVLYVYICKHKP